MNFSSIKKSYLVLGLLGLAAVLVIGWLIYRAQTTDSSEPQTNINGEVEGVEEEEEVVDEPVEEEEPGAPVSQVPEGERPAAIERDQQRLADIKSLRDALAKYFTDNESYPERLDGLVPSYLSKLPADPLGDQAKVPYTYTPIGSLPATYYDLGYYMEVGVEGLQPIEHDATPDNLTIMQEL